MRPSSVVLCATPSHHSLVRPTHHRRAWLAGLLTCTALLLPVAVAIAEDAKDSVPENVAEGRALALELRRQRPAENSTNQAVLRVRDPDNRISEVPVTVVTGVSPEQWQVTYRTRPAGSPQGAIQLQVTHSPTTPPRYELTGQPAAGPGSAVALSPFAGTDFWVADLGLEFLHWPQQRIVKRDLAGTRLCHVLESVNPGTQGYAKVWSWIDSEYHGLIAAEAYDAKGLLVKKFFADSFKKVGDTWMLKDIRLTNEKTGSKTYLIFDLPGGK